MSDKLDFPVPYKGASAHWFINPIYRRVFTGHEYAHRCVAAIGPADFSRVAFVVTTNPRQKAGTMGKAVDSSLFVHECAWGIARTAEHVHADTMQDIADRYGISKQRVSVIIRDQTGVEPRSHGYRKPREAQAESVNP